MWKMLVRLCIVMLACSEISASGMWIDVPFVRQQEKGCGAASISMVLRYWTQHGIEVPPFSHDPERIYRLLYSKEDNGIRAEDLARYFHEHGFEPFVFSGEWRDLEHHLSRGRPLIVTLSLNEKTGPLHYVVVVGIHAGEDVILLNDPAQRKLLKMDRSRFEKSWGAMKNWTLLAVPENDH